ncbi:Ff.00g133700.m01.CDS01 [Fusarium sp. VM40]|nr:Ff.00g133700.m01.CDS01 [Fusarium sp. VM40]
MTDKGEILVFTRKATTAGNDRKLQKLVDDYENKGIMIQVTNKQLKVMFPVGSQAERAATYTAKNLRAWMEEDGLLNDWEPNVK